MDKRIPEEMISTWGPAAADRAWRENCEMMQRAADAALLDDMVEISPTIGMAWLTAGALTTEMRDISLTMPHQPTDFPGT